MTLEIPFLAVCSRWPTCDLLATADWCVDGDNNYITSHTANTTPGDDIVLFPATPCNAAAQQDGSYYVMTQVLVYLGFLFSEVPPPKQLPELASSDPDPDPDPSLDPDPTPTRTHPPGLTPTRS